MNISDFHLLDLLTSTSYYQCDHRAILENFFTDVYADYKRNEGPVYNAISASIPFAKKIKIEAGKLEPGKQILDRAIRDDENIRHAVWDLYNIGKQTPYPLLSSNLVYGVLSHIVHDYEFRAVLVSDNAPIDFSNFFRYLADKKKKDFELYSAIAATAGKELDVRVIFIFYDKFVFVFFKSSKYDHVFSSYG